MNAGMKLAAVYVAGAILIAGCGKSNSGNAGTSPSQPVAAAQSQTSQTPSIAGNHKVGEVVQGDGFTVVLNDAQFIGYKLKANFTITNNGTKEMHLSMLSFDAKNADGSRLKQEIMNCGSSSVGGSVVPGDKLKGDVCWDGAIAPSKVYFKAELLGGSTVWEVTQ